MTDAKSAYGKNHLPRSSCRRVRIHFFSCVSIFTCTGTSSMATMSPMTSIASPIMSGTLMSIFVKKGSKTIKRIETRETFPEIRDAVIRYSSQRQSFSSVPLRNDDKVPVEKALLPSAIAILPAQNTQKLSATR